MGVGAGVLNSDKRGGAGVTQEAAAGGGRGRGWGGGTDSSLPADSPFPHLLLLAPSASRPEMGEKATQARPGCRSTSNTWTKSPRELGTVGPSQMRENEKKPQSHLPLPNQPPHPRCAWASPARMKAHACISVPCSDGLRSPLKLRHEVSRLLGPEETVAPTASVVPCRRPGLEINPCCRKGLVALNWFFTDSLVISLILQTLYVFTAYLGPCKHFNRSRCK